jgi:hypothetical protein
MDSPDIGSYRLRQENYIVGEIIATEREDVPELHNTLQVAVTQAAAAMMIRGFSRISADSYPYVARINGNHEETIIKGPDEMTVTTTEHPHIVRDPRIGQGEPIITGTGIRVRTLVEYW